MKKILFILMVMVSSLSAEPLDYEYKLIETTENKDNNNVLISVHVTVQASKLSDIFIYPTLLDEKQFALYKADINNFKTIVEDIFAVAKARLDIQIESKPKEVKYSDAQKDAVPVDKVAIDTKAEAIKDEQKDIAK